MATRGRFYTKEDDDERPFRTLEKESDTANGKARTACTCVRRSVRGANVGLRDRDDPHMTTTVTRQELQTTAVAYHMKGNIAVEMLAGWLASATNGVRAMKREGWDTICGGGCRSSLRSLAP